MSPSEAVMIDSKKIIIGARKRYLSTLKALAVANSFAAKIEPVLPRGWTVSFYPDSLDVFCPEREDAQAALQEFMYVAKIVEIAIGKKLSRSPVIGDELYALAANGWLSQNETTLYINISQHNTKDCKLRKETKEVFVLDEDCQRIIGDGANA